MSYYIRIHDFWSIVEPSITFNMRDEYETEAEAIEYVKDYMEWGFETSFENVDKIDDIMREYRDERDRPQIRSTNRERVTFDEWGYLSKTHKAASWYDNETPQTIYQQTLRFAADKHNGQLFPGTEIPYLFHISCVASEIYAAKVFEYHPAEFNLGYALALACLHDALEDTDTTAEELDEKFGKYILYGVRALTKDQNIEKKKRMQDSLDRIKKGPREVSMVKLADRITNLMPPPQHWNKAKIKSYYEESRQIYDALGSASMYLGSRLLKKMEEYKKYFEPDAGVEEALPSTK